MPFLTVSRRGESLFRYPLSKSPITIGREIACDLPLSGDAVSRAHCILEWNGKTRLLVDKSRNGTFLNDARMVAPTVLKSSDVVQIGEWTLEYCAEELPITTETVENDRQPTLVLKYDPAEKTLTTETLHFCITPVKGTGQERTIRRLPVTLGGAAGNDIVVSEDPYVSRTHCVIEQSPAGLLLRDTGSRNATWWQGAKIASQVLPPAGAFVIGKTHVSYRIEERVETVAPSRRRRCGELLGASRALQEIFALIERVAPSDATVLIQGESGTGKELCARAIHAASLRANRPFVAINCGALPANIVESELFGHERGAFTGATSQHRGVFEQAHGGTLFLDEIGEMSIELQTRLLRVLETRTVRRVGGTAEINVDCRLVAATHQELRALVTEGRFREDLYYRLYVVPIVIPPLKERSEDVELMIDHYLQALAPKGQRAVCSPAAREALRRYRWPGNVRELRNTLQRALLLAGPGPVQPEHLIFAPATMDGLAEDPSLNAQERRAIVTALADHKGNCTQAAKQLGIARTTLSAKMKKYGISAQSPA
ncbi:MAG: sigma 54-interacting transcriptional regulator [Deltaproteobacteria bacterium]|nr:sigma 54-interacting transcriptional regulator [Deltaproteobacteria bacterium]